MKSSTFYLRITIQYNTIFFIPDVVAGFWVGLVTSWFNLAGLIVVSPLNNSPFPDTFSEGVGLIIIIVARQQCNIIHKIPLKCIICYNNFHYFIYVN